MFCVVVLGVVVVLHGKLGVCCVCTGCVYILVVGPVMYCMSHVMYYMMFVVLHVIFGSAVF